MKIAKKRFLYLMVFTFSSLLYVNIGYATTLTKTTTVTSKFDITNRVIENVNIASTDKGFSYRDMNGYGLYALTDNFNDATIDNLRGYTGGNQQWGSKRKGSLFKVKMTGQHLGHSFYVLGKYAKSSFDLYAVTGSSGNQGALDIHSYIYSMGNCTKVIPNTDIFKNSYPVSYTIEIGASMAVDCRANTVDVTYSPLAVIKTEGKSREVYLDIGGLQKNADYRKAPPDIYKGNNPFFAEELYARVGGSFQFIYNNVITIQKNPYFEGITLPAGDNVFDVKKVNNQFKGNLTIPYVINGQFTPFNKIKLEVTSTNNFKLKNTEFSGEIPYSLSTTIGVRKLNIVDNGVTVNPLSTVTFSDLSKEFYALQGRFDADFSVSTSIPTGGYTDTVTAVYTISL